MAVYLQDADLTVHHGDALATLCELPAESAHMCVTSPPFFGLRDYGTGSWQGGDPGCDHEAAPRTLRTGPPGAAKQASNTGSCAVTSIDGDCPCGARRVDQQIGLEASPDQWVASLVAVFREVHRVLRHDGTLWVEVGDSYATQPGKGSNVPQTKWPSNSYPDGAPHRSRAIEGIKPKDLVGAPWLLAFALRADGWYLRSDIIWARPNPMPESVTDRPTKSHSYVFLLAKQPRYYYDADAIREAAEYGYRQQAPYGKSPDGLTRPRVAGTVGGNGDNPAAGRNKRSVWTIPTQPLPDQHYAAYPEALVEPCILAGCPEDGTVLDPFLGSGTTALVARRLGRRCVGIELSADYCRMIARRTQQLSLLGDAV